MNGEAGLGVILTGGLTAVATPALAPAVAVVAAAAFAVGRRLRRVEHLVAALVVMLIFVAATTRRGVESSGGFALVVGWVALVALVVVLRDHHGAWRAPFAGLVVGVTAVLWRVGAYGPVLLELRGGWQSPPPVGDLAVYHLGTGVALAATHLVAAEAGRRVPTRWAIMPWVAGILASGVLLLTGLWSDLVRVMMMRWPHVPFG